MIEEKRKQLLKLYEEWYSELEKTCPQFMCEDFSHPYYLHIPDEWYERKCRILIVGEEGHGDGHFYKTSIKEAQDFNRDYLACQLKKYDTKYGLNTSAFWNRIRKIAALPKPDEFSMTWTNIDKIHHNGSGSKSKNDCPLSKNERYDLHQTKKQILAEEIKILQPNVVVFCGCRCWYDISFEAELPKVYRKLKQYKRECSSQWKENKIKTILECGISYIFTYHPGWGQRQKGYEEKVLSEVKGIIDNILTENH